MSAFEWDAVSTMPNMKELRRTGKLIVYGEDDSPISDFGESSAAFSSTSLIEEGNTAKSANGDDKPGLIVGSFAPGKRGRSRPADAARTAVEPKSMFARYEIGNHDSSA